MGNQLATRSTSSAGALHDLPGVTAVEPLGQGQFLRSLKCLGEHDTLLVVKVYV